MSLLTSRVLPLVLAIPSEPLEHLTQEQRDAACRRLNSYLNSRRMTETQFQADVWCRTSVKSVDDLHPITPWKFPTPKTVCQELAEVLTVTLAPLGVPFATLVCQTMWTLEGRLDQELLNLLYDPTVDNRPLLSTDNIFRESKKEVSKAESLLASLPE